MNARATCTLLLTAAVGLGLVTAPALAADDTALATAVSPTPADFGKGVKATAKGFVPSACLEGKLKPGSTAMVRKGFDIVLAAGETVATVYPDTAKAAAALSTVATSKLGPCFVADAQKHATTGEKYKSFTSSKLPLAAVGDHSSAYRVVVKFKTDTIIFDFAFVQRKRVVVLLEIATGIAKPDISEERNILKLSASRVP